MNRIHRPNCFSTLRCLFRQLVLVILAGFLFAACTRELPVQLPDDTENLVIYTLDDATRSAGAIQLIETERFEDSSGQEFNISGTPAVDHKGRVFIYDRDENRQVVNVFSSDGVIIGQIGEPGQGRGQFQGIQTLQALGDNLFIYDRELDKIEVYDTDSLGLVSTLFVYPEIWDIIEELDYTYVDTFYANSDSTITLRLRKQTIYDYDSTQTVIYYNMSAMGMQLTPNKKILEHPDAEFIHDRSEAGIRSRRSILTGVQRKPLMAVSSESHFFQAWSEELLIREYLPDGTFLKGFFYPIPGTPLEKDEFLGTLSSIEQGILAGSEFPNRWPVLDNLFIDDENRLWISLNRGDTETTQWWVTDENGHRLGEFTWDRNKPIFEIRDGYVYTREQHDPMNPWISKYRIEMP